MKRFKLTIKKELFIYLLMFFILTLLIHSDLLGNPSSRFEMMYKKGNYFHPFLYSFVIYSVLFIVRKILDFLIGLFEKKSN